MYKNGYFKEEKEELTYEHANGNYEKTIRWIERGNVPEFLRNDINDFVINERKIKNNELLKLPPPGPSYLGMAFFLARKIRDCEASTFKNKF